MSRAGGHFCEHGNLRHGCGKCRAERRAQWAGRTQNRRPAQAVRAGKKPPQRAWTTTQPLDPRQTAAVQAVRHAGGGVVRVPSGYGLARIAFALLRAARNEAQAIVLITPSERSLQSWDEALRTQLHVPAEEIDAAGRAIRDWDRLPSVILQTPSLATRHSGPMRSRAKNLVLLVDSPASSSHEGLETLFEAPFAMKMGIESASLYPSDRATWPRIDALGGIVHEVGIDAAIDAGDLRPFRLEHVRHGHDDDGAEATIAKHIAAQLGETRRAVIIVDDVEQGRLLEEALAQRGIEPRFVGDAATPGLAERAGAAIQAGTARVLVETLAAPAVPTGPIDVLGFCSHDIGDERAARTMLRHMADVDRAPLTVVDLAPDEPPADRVQRQRHARRLVRLAGAAAHAVAPIPWITAALPVRPLPPDVAERLAASDLDTPWQQRLAWLPDAMEQGIDEEHAAAALADAHIAHALNVPTHALGPPGTGDTQDLLMPLLRRESLVALAPIFDDAARALGALLRRDLRQLVAVYSGSPILHHIVPRLRRLVIATLQDLSDDRAPERDAGDPVGVARRLLERGGSSGPVPPSEPAVMPEAVSASSHLDRLLAGLDAERQLEQDEQMAEIHHLTGPERQRQGRTLLGLATHGRRRDGPLVGIRYGLARAPGTGPPPSLPYTEMGPGSLVHLSSGDAYDPVMKGTVGDVGERHVEIVVEEDHSRRAPAEDVRIDLVGNPRVFETLATAVRKVYGPGRLAATSSTDGAPSLRAHLLLETAGAASTTPKFTYRDAGLNTSQKEAVTACLGAPRLSLVHGPPGTGKTTTLVEMIHQAVARGERLLVTADSNAAVDNILDAYQASGGIGVRVGPRPSLTRPHLAPLHHDTLRGRAPGIDWLRRIPVIFSTHVSSARLPDDLRFDVCIQDEASQATEPASCVPLVRAPKLILAGDHLQLPPVVRSTEAVEHGLGISLFERLHAAYGTSHGHLLAVQYRMHKDIAKWSNDAFYEGRIETAVDPPPLVAGVEVGAISASPRAIFVDVKGAEAVRRTSKERSSEAEEIAHRVQTLLDADVGAERVAVIAAYRAQVRLLRRMLDGSGVEVGTIDAFQGSERDIIFVSLVRSNVRGEVGFVRDPRRLNVAMTRARRHLVVVGDASTLGREPLLAQLIASLGRGEPVSPKAPRARGPA